MLTIKKLKETLEELGRQSQSKTVKYANNADYGKALKQQGFEEAVNHILLLIVNEQKP